MVAAIILGGIVILAVVLKLTWPHIARFWASESDPDLRDPESHPEPEIPDYNEDFIEQGRNEPSIQLVRFFNQYDKIFLRSILHSAGIPNYCKNETFNGQYGGIRIDGLTDAIVEVYLKDKEEAVEIVKDYLERSRLDLEYKPQVGTAISLLAAGYIVPRTRGRMLPELLVE